MTSLLPETYRGCASSLDSPKTYVTMLRFLEPFNLGSIRDLPDTEIIENEGLLSKRAALSGELAAAFGIEPASVPTLN